MFPESIYSFPVSSFNYTVPYLFLAIIVLIIGYKWVWKSTKDPFPIGLLSIIAVLFVLFFGLRWHILSDTIEYYSVYKSVREDFSLSYIVNYFSYYYMDPGFFACMVLSKILGLSFQTFLFWNSVFDFLIFSICLRRYSINIPLSCLLFLAFYGIFIEINLMRNIKSILLFLYSIRYIQERRLGMFLIFQLIGFTFHSSALLYIPMYWILTKELTKRFLIVFASVFITIYFIPKVAIQEFFTLLILDNSAVSSKLVSHISANQDLTLSIGAFERIGTLILAIYVYLHNKDRGPFFVMFFNCYLLYFSLFSFFSFNVVFQERIPILFAFSYWFLYPYLLDFLTTRTLLFKGFLLLFLFVKICDATRWSSAYYENVLFETCSINQREYLNSKSEK